MLRHTLGIRSGRAAWIVSLVVLGLGATGAASAADAASCTYAMRLTALTGPREADLEIDVEAAAGCAAVGRLEHVQLKTFAADGSLADVRNLRDVAAPDGSANIGLGELARNLRVEAHVQVKSGAPARTYVLRGATATRLRPDLVVERVVVAPQTLTTRPVGVSVVIAERNGDTGANAKVTLSWEQPTAEEQPVIVPAGGRATVTFADIALTEPSITQLSAIVHSASVSESDTTNNSGGAAVDVTEHELVRANVLISSLGGYGAQFNQHVYAPITNATPATLPDMEAKAKALEPQLVRIFYNDNWEERRPDAPANMESFLKTVDLAQEAGATINITYQAVNVAKLQPIVAMTRFAAVLQNLVESRGDTNVRWVTVANEPNSTALTLAEYEALYRALHAQLVERGLRDHIALMGGDLVEGPVGTANDHRNWWRYMAEHMNDILDAYSVHIYWQYFDIPRMEFRLKDVHQIITEELPVEARKPTYIMEFAVRGIDTAAGKPNKRFAYWEDGTEMRRTNVAAFQQLWFFVQSAQLGYTGAAKWDAYWGMYDLSSVNNQVYWMTGTAAEGWPLFPTYHALRLLLQTTQRGWEGVQVAPWEDDDWKLVDNEGKPLRDQPEKEIAAFAGPNSYLTLMGLDTHARLLNTDSPETPAYSIGGLPPSTELNLAIWNAAADGVNSIAGKVTTSSAGVARFDVPLHAAFALTTVPGS